MRLLVAEDDPRLLKSLLHILSSSNFTADGVSNGKDALNFAQTEEYDGMILDIMMPGMDGIAVLKELRAKGISTPALFLSARSEVEHRVEGLDAGADDYLAKPFATSELLARIRAMLRRKDTFTPDLMEFGDLTLNRSTFQLGCRDQSLTLSGKEYQILELLMQRPGMITSAEQIISHVWGWEAEADISSLWVHISHLRKKMEALGTRAEIRFVRYAGYLLEEEA